MVIKCLSSWDTEYCADTVEWCPALIDVFAVGTYQVVNDPENSTFDGKSQRKGRLYLGSFHEGSIQIQDTLETRAILDLSWCPRASKRLASVDAGGELSIYTLKEDHLRLEKSGSWSNEEETLLLSIDWKHEKIALSDGGGHLSILDVVSLQPSFRVKAHDFEAWIIAFDAMNSNVVFSGGDDSKLKGYDLRMETPTFVCKEHNAGVTSLLSHPTLEYKLFSGSYDEVLREWDSRKMRVPLRETSLGGGVWRIKYNPERKLLATACMHNGYHILDEEGGIMDSFMEHESLAYGLDWHASRPRRGASCSFYDHSLKIWELGGENK